jgi:hypothetical protein
MRTFKLNTIEVSLKKEQYRNKRLSISAIDCGDGTPFAKLTVNFPDEDMLPGEFAIKDWAENEGFYIQLLDQGVILPHTRRLSVGNGCHAYITCLGGRFLGAG